MAFRDAALPRDPGALRERMRRTAERPPPPCHHCGGVGCGCGQKEAGEVVELAVLLPKPAGSHVAEVELARFVRGIPAGPRFTSSEIVVLGRAAESLASYYRLSRQPESADACEAVARAAEAATAKMP